MLRAVCLRIGSSPPAPPLLSFDTMFEALPEDTPSISIVQFKMWWLKVSGGVKAEASSDIMGKLADHVSASRAS